MKKTHSIYVIELDKSILKNKAFIKMNPNYDDSKPCVYVGMTSKTPEQRFLEHTNGLRTKKGFPKEAVFIFCFSSNPPLFSEPGKIEFCCS